MMIGWRRKARAERARLEAQAAENPMSAERLYELVSQTLHANFGPLGSYAITRRATSDTDDIFHTMLASSVAHDIVNTLMHHRAVPVLPPAPAGGSFVAATSAFAESHALPARPLMAPVEAPAVVRVGNHAGDHVAGVVDAPSAAGPVEVVRVVETVPVVEVVPVAASVAATPAAVLPAPLAPVVAVPVSADLAAALTVLDETGEIALPAPVAAVRSHLVDAGR